LTWKFRLLAATHRACWSLAVVAACSDVLVGSLPPLACRMNWLSMAWYRPTSAARFGGIPLAARTRLRVTFDIPWASALALAVA
jgi:hypothetical protein